MPNITEATPGAAGPSPGRVRVVIWATASALGLVLVVLTTVFLVFSVLPSDPIRNALGVNASEVAIAALRTELGYDRPLPERYARFIASAVQLDFGRSVHTRQPVRPMVIEAMGITARNGAIALGASVLVSFSLTAVAFLTNRRVERGIVFLCRVLTSVPSLIVAIVVGMMAYSLLGSFAEGGARATLGIIAAIAVYPICSLAEIGVSEAARVRHAGFVAASRCFGMSESSIFVRCVLPVVLTSWMGQLSNLAASIIVSSTVFEVVFSLPGLGNLLARAVVKNDLPVMQGIAVAIVLIFLGVDAIFDRVLLPRVAVNLKGTT